jgi:hypothetical protein
MRLCTLAVAISALLLSTVPASAENVGEATRGARFAYQTPPQTQRGPLYRLNPVIRNSRLETVPSGALEVTFTDGSRLTLGSASSVVVDNYVYAGPQGAGQQTLKMTKGVFRFVSGSMPKDRVRMETPTVSIGIRGTIVKMEVNEDGSGTINFEQGSGFIDNGKGQNVPMSEGDVVTVAADGTIGTPSQQGWTAGDVAVDQGMNPFNQSFGGTEGGSGGGDGAGSAGSSGSPSNAL